MKTSSPGSRIRRRLLLVAALSFALTLFLSPAAVAQIDSVTGGVGGAVDGATGSVGDATGSVGGAVGGAVGGVTEPVTGGGDGSSSPSGSNPIGKVVEGVNKTVDKGKSTVDEASTTVGDTKEAIGGATGSVGGSVGTVLEGTKGKLDGVKKAIAGPSKKKKGANGGTAGANAGQRTGGAAPDRTLVRDAGFAAALRADGRAIELASATASTSQAAAGVSFADQIGRIAAEAAERIAFPIALMLLVAGFLMVQNRIDRKDPKLALAPIDSEQDLLSFT